MSSPIKPATPLPWHLDRSRQTILSPRKSEPDRYFMHDIPITIAHDERDAAYIVTACNEFQALVEALDLLWWVYNNENTKLTNPDAIEALLTRCGVNL